MNKAWRILSGTLAALSALLCICLLVLLIRSFFVVEGVRVARWSVAQSATQEQPGFYRQDFFHLNAMLGGLLLAREEMVWEQNLAPNQAASQWTWEYEPWVLDQLPREMRKYPTLSFYGNSMSEGLGAKVGVDWLGYGVGVDRGPVIGEAMLTAYVPKPSRVATVPLPLLILLTVILPALWLRRWLRERSLARRGFAVEPAGPREERVRESRED